MYRKLGQAEWAIAAIGGGACLSAILLLTVITVFGRYVLEQDLIPGGYNMIEGAFFPLMVFWGLPLAHREGSFPRLETLDAFRSSAFARLLAAAVLLVEGLIYALVLYYCAKFALMSWETGRQLQIGTGYWPSWPIAIMAPISFALMLVEVVRLITRDVRAALGRAAPTP